MASGLRHPALRAELRRAQKNRCCYCGCRMVLSRQTSKAPNNAETLEHLQRRAEGGTNARWNVALACRRCNLNRGDLDWLTYTTIRRGEHWEKW